MKYKIVVTEEMERLLDERVAYLLNELNNAQAASHLLEGIEEIYNYLKTDPMIYRESQDSFMYMAHYCTTHCPKELPIPELISLYNEHKVTGGGFIAPMAVASMAADKRPANCVGCRRCEQVCPQQIKISEMMTDFTAMIGM